MPVKCTLAGSAATVTVAVVFMGPLQIIRANPAVCNSCLFFYQLHSRAADPASLVQPPVSLYTSPVAFVIHTLQIQLILEPCLKHTDLEVPGLSEKIDVEANVMLPGFPVESQRKDAAPEVAEEGRENSRVRVDKNGTIRLLVDGPPAGKHCGEEITPINEGADGGGEFSAADIQNNLLSREGI